LKNLDLPQLLEAETKRPPKIVIVGRANVGKSTLFNRLSQSRRAIVGNKEGITVDRQEILVEDTPINKPFALVDTGGVGGSLEDHFLGDEIEAAAEHAIENADLILFVADGSVGLHSEDEKVALWLRKRLPRKRSVPVWAMINKCDRKDFDMSSFYSLGFDKFFDISCEHNVGFSDFWEDLSQAKFALEELNEESPDVMEQSRADARILVLGRPNMGKSSLINKLTGIQAHVVSNVAGTTRDITTSMISYQGYDWNLHDTAGLRRPGRRERQVEWVAGEKIKKMAKKSDIALILMDSSEGVTDMDQSICGFAMDAGLSMALLYNKWDLVEGAEDPEQKAWNFQRTEDLKTDFLQWVPRLKISAKTGMGLNQILPTVRKLAEARNQRIQTSTLNKVFEEKIQNREHPGVDGALRVKFYYLSQVATNPPEFIMFTNVDANRIHFSFRRYIINVLRDEFGFEGCPLKIHFKKR